MLRFDHVFVFAKDAKRSSDFLAQILGIPPALPSGPDGDIYRLEIEAAGAVQYHPHDGEIPTHHIAFRVDRATFDAALKRLQQMGIEYGNDPEETKNLKYSDFLGGYGRIFFLDPDGHLFEIVA
ncbi:MAG: VOC family protein [Caldilineaceae bacterium]